MMIFWVFFLIIKEMRIIKIKWGILINKLINYVIILLIMLFFKFVSILKIVVRMIFIRVFNKLICREK